MFHVCLCYAVMSVPCSLVITCWESADLLALLCVMDVSCIFVTVSYGVPGQVWYMIVSIQIFVFFITLNASNRFRLIIPVSIKKQATIGPPAIRHSNGVSLAGRLWPDVFCWLGF